MGSPCCTEQWWECWHTMPQSVADGQLGGQSQSKAVALWKPLGFDWWMCLGWTDRGRLWHQWQPQISEQLSRMTWQFTYKVLHLNIVKEMWLRSLWNASHRTVVLLHYWKPSSQFSTPPTPRHWHCCLALTVCALLSPKNIYKFTCPVFLEEMTHTSAGFSMATMALAAKSSFSQVFFKLMMYTPRLMAEQIHFHT